MPNWHDSRLAPYWQLHLELDRRQLLGRHSKILDQRQPARIVYDLVEQLR